MLFGFAVLAACAKPGVQAPDADVARFRYPGVQPSTLSLVTNIRNKTGKGAHSALIVNASEQVVFNPAGTWWHPQAPEQGDLHYGFSPGMKQWFIDYHARETFRVQIQTIEVSPEVAEQALELVKAYGSVPPSQCTIAISRILHQLPGFESISVTLFPSSAADAFGKLPGVVTEVYRDDSPDNRSDLGTFADG
ncbi:hypothetical protein BV911_06000 [Pseudoruegeria sp. SK021]|nr:hypothetical protein BV911_06000 [Pseudoruegeria sp. SK021]